MKKTTKMTSGNPAKIILLFALPLMLGNLFNQLYYVIDTAIVGQFVGLEALSAVGATDWLNYLFTSIILLFPQGFAILIARTYGKKAGKELNEVIQNSLFLSLIIALLVVVLGESLLVPCLKLISTPEEIIGLSETYLRIILAGVPLNMLFQIMGAILRSYGDSKSPLIAMIVASIINIGLDLWFILSFNMGVAGAALATIIAQGCSGLVVTFFAVKHRLFTLKEFKLNFKLIKQLLILAFPVALQGVIISVGGLAVQGVVNQYGKEFIAGYTATNKLYGLLEICATSYGLGITTYVSQNYGAKLAKRIKNGVNVGAILSVVTAIVISLIMVFGGKLILSIFIDQTNPNKDYVLNVSYEYLLLMAIFLPILYLLYNYRSAIQGLSNTVIPMLSGVAELVVRIVCAYTLPLLLKEKGLYYAEVLAWVGAVLLLIPAFYIIFNRKKHII